MNWFKRANKEFDFSHEKDQIWNSILEQEGEYKGLSSIPGENNDCNSQIKDVDLDVQVPEGRNQDQKFRVRAQLCQTSMDWECPLYYFKCQYFQKFLVSDDEKNDTRPYTAKGRFIFIPIHEQGNHNLNGNSLKNNDDGCETIDEKQLWDWVETACKERIQAYLQRKTEYENVEGGYRKAEKEYRIFTGVEDAMHGIKS